MNMKSTTMIRQDTRITDTITAMVYRKSCCLSGQTTFFISIFVSRKNRLHAFLFSSATSCLVNCLRFAILTPSFYEIIILFPYAGYVYGTTCNISSFQFVQHYSSCSCSYDNYDACNQDMPW